MTRCRRVPAQFAVALVVALLAACASADRDPALAGYFATPLQIVTADGRRHEFAAYMAVTPSQREHGLMYVENLPPDQGMLFLFETLRPWSMWMKNTRIPLDMLFIRPDGTIASIITDTEPGSLEPRAATEPVTAVLELNAGTVARLGIAPGDRIDHRAFTATP